MTDHQPTLVFIIGPPAVAAKPFKRDLAASRQQLLELDDKYQLNSRGRLAGRPDYLHVEKKRPRLRAEIREQRSYLFDARDGHLTHDRESRFEMAVPRRQE